MAAHPLQWAEDSGHLDIVKALLKAGANPNLANNQDLTPLHMAERWGKTQVVSALKAVPDVKPRALHEFIGSDENDRKMTLSSTEPPPELENTARAKRP